MNNKNCCPRGKHLYRVVSLGHCCFDSFLRQKGFVSVALRLVTSTWQAGRPLLQMAAAGDEPSRQACSASRGRERDRAVERGEGEGEHRRQREAPAAAEPGTDLVCRSCNRVCLSRIGLYSQSRCGNLTRDWNHGADFMVPRLTDANNNNIFLAHWWVHRGKDISRSLTTRKGGDIHRLYFHPRLSLPSPCSTGFSCRILHTVLQNTATVVGLNFPGIFARTFLIVA